MASMNQDPRAAIPNINFIKQHIQSIWPEDVLEDVVLRRLARFVAAWLRQHPQQSWSMELCRRLLTPLLYPGPQPMINATGILLHTNMGRAPLEKKVVQQALDQVAGYTDLELNPTSGRRGHRDSHIAALARLLWDVEDATLVNNAAAAVCLSLAALAAGRETLVSRGELIEIGGSFRLPDVMQQAGTRLHEVGTTNRTRLTDFERAVSAETGCIIKAHPSNYRVEGFTQEVPLTQLVELGRCRDIPVVYDLGSGYSEISGIEAPCEPSIEAALSAAPDLLIFSCDKLLGGVQAGLVLGRREAIAKLRKHTMMRLLRADKLTISVVCGALAHLHLGRPSAIAQLCRQQPADLQHRAERLAAQLGNPWRVIADQAYIGGGSLPGQARSSFSLALPADGNPQLADQLRARRPGLLVTTRDGLLRVNLASVFPQQDSVLAEILAEI